jgi:hypothetical protein
MVWNQTVVSAIIMSKINNDACNNNSHNQSEFRSAPIECCVHNNF